MDTTIYTDLGNGITCIDAEYVRRGLACFYLLEHRGQCAIIETGTSHSVRNLELLMEIKGIAPEQVRYVIPTHVHLDHAGGAGQMMALFPNAQLVIHPKGARHMVTPERLVASAKQVYGEEAFAKLYGEIVAVDEARVLVAEDGDIVSLGDRRLEFRHTPGHADHHFCVWDEGSHAWFSGDMFGISYPEFRFETGNFVLPATTPTQFRPDQFVQSVDLLRGYTPRSLYLTHYGELPYSDEAADLLCGQVSAYKNLASMGNSGQLREALVGITADFMRPLNPPGGVERFEEMLEMDVMLNVQGVEVWLQRVANGSLAAG